MLSRVDYCNSLYADAPATSTKRLQSLINMAARVVSGCSRFNHITDFTRDYLHWLPIQQQVDFKICSMVLKAWHDLSPIYVTEMMKPTSMIPRRQDLRSASRCDLIIPKHRTKFAEHAFIITGPVAWNRLSQIICEAPSLTTSVVCWKHICLSLLTQTVDYVQCHCGVRSSGRYINSHFKLN